MTVKKNVLAFAVISFYAIGASAQIEKKADTVITMKEAVVVSNRLDQFIAGNKVFSFDSLSLQNSLTADLSELIQTYSPLLVNSYGPKGLSTISVRGTGDSRTAILWNGFSIKDALNGTADLSQFPVLFADNVKIQYGGSGAINGSGAIGGAVYINSNLNFDSGAKSVIYADAGSFSDYNMGAGVKISRKKYAFSLRTFSESVKNNFKYRNIFYGDSLFEQNNAATTRHGAMFDQLIYLNKIQKIKTSIWIQNNKHEIIPDMQYPGKSDENNDFVRSSAEWSALLPKLQLFARTAYLNNFKRYEDEIALEKTFYKTEMSISEVESNFLISDLLKCNAGLNNTYEYGHSDNIDGSHYRNRFAAFASLIIKSKNNLLHSVFSLREEFINDNNTPVTFSAGIDYNFFRALTVKGNINRSYNVPTLNDLYYKEISSWWSSVGNPDLKPESGLNEELGVEYNGLFGKFSVKAEITGYNSYITNWIAWQSNDYITWSPQNLNTVWSRGAEFQTTVKYKTKDFEVNFSDNFSYTLTTDETPTAPDSLSHFQLPYVPVNKAGLTAAVIYKGVGLTYNFAYTGKRHYSISNLYLPEYTISGVIVSKRFKVEKNLVSLDLKINNIFNKDYVSIAWYPMPRRSFIVGVKINFNDK